MRSGDEPNDDESVRCDVNVAQPILGREAQGGSAHGGCFFKVLLTTALLEPSSSSDAAAAGAAAPLANPKPSCSKRVLMQDGASWAKKRGSVTE